MTRLRVGSDEWSADPELAAIARALVAEIKADLTIDWANHEAKEAAIRVKIKHLLRRQGYSPLEAGGRPLERVVDVVLDQARALYRHWPDMPDFL